MQIHPLVVEWFILLAQHSDRESRPNQWKRDTWCQLNVDYTPLEKCGDPWTVLNQFEVPTSNLIVEKTKEIPLLRKKIFFFFGDGIFYKLLVGFLFIKRSIILFSLDFEGGFSKQ